MREKGYTVIKKIMQRKMRIHWQSEEGLSKGFGYSMKEASKLTVANAYIEHELVELFPLLKVSDLN